MNTQQSLTLEQGRLLELLEKCDAEQDPARLLRHLQAVKTYLLAHVVQQSALYHQMQGGQIVEGALEDRIITECAGCMGESHKLMVALHRFLHKHPDESTVNTMEFRVEANRLTTRFLRNIRRFQTWMAGVDQLRMAG